MSVPPHEDKRAAARRLLAERARRVTTIRRRIVAGALAAFVMAWSVIAWTGSMGTTTSTADPAAVDRDVHDDGLVQLDTTTQDGPTAMTTQQS